MEDVTRDLNFALEGRARHGQRLPFLLMLDNGSTEEDVPAYENLAHYDVPIAVVDHHHPDPEAVDPLLDAHVNPYLHDEDYRITTGMLCVELARMIDPDLTDDLQHVPAVAGLSDRSEAEAMRDYIGLASEKGYDENICATSAKPSTTRPLAALQRRRRSDHDVLNVDCDDRDRHGEVVEFLSERAERDVEDQLDAAMRHVDHERLDSGAHLYTIDVENCAHRFTYPAPGKTTGKLHDRKVHETGEPVITIGYGPTSPSSAPTASASTSRGWSPSSARRSTAAASPAAATSSSARSSSSGPPRVSHRRPRREDGRSRNRRGARKSTALPEEV